jgi:Xaa-Pro aminopeptidase
VSGHHPYFDAVEFATRAERVRFSLRRLGVDIALFDEIEAMTWLSGYGNSENRWRCVGLPVEGEPFFLIRALDAGPCRQRSWIADVVSFRDWEDPMPVLAESLAARGLAGARVGLDFGSYCMPPARLARLRAALPAAQLVDIGSLVWELRLIKSAAEIALLRRAGAVADEALRATAAACVRGATQRLAAKVAMGAFLDLGADPGPPGPISAGRGWDFLHGHLEDAPLGPGDVVHIELTPRVGGYSARLMRCAVIGEPSRALQDAAERLVEIQDRQIAAMRPGAAAAEIDAILREPILRQGLRESYDNITGYTLGFYAAAGPRTSDFTRAFHPGADWTLEPDMVFHMYASAAGLSFSETVHVTPAGPARLTNIPRTLLVNGA